ncbi:AraC family transcriptional regulator [Streptomyces acidiscabies]|uniref:AraC family transcriptional regulator n=1 Tax=Streptomyces acidiscabies TaxID=42234 RepID=UPI00073ED7AF|nr:AraC family transcriptional regulator [Streptomyces acidiscabies]GAQ54488.1 xylose operon regulatory protein [Streptomyces acidiscabies]
MDVLSDAVTAMRTGRPHSSRTRWDAPWGVRFAPFAGAGFHVVLQGSCWVLPHRAEPVRLGVGDIALLPHGTSHALADDPATPLREAAAPGSLPPSPDGIPADTILLCGAYLLDQDRRHPLLAELPEVVHLSSRVGAHPELRAVIDLLGAELDRPREGSGAVVPALLDTLLLYTLRAWHDEQNLGGRSSEGWAAALHDPAIAAALRAIHQNPGRAWTVQSLAAVAGLSRSPFARRFTALVGSPPLGYLTWWRMTTAAGLLRGDDRPVQRVAEQVGYVSEFAFGKAFKRAYGTSPGRYRRHGGGSAREAIGSGTPPRLDGAPDERGLRG